ncbi:transcriptional adapter 2-beta [Heptranchias perlo]|uniref:transcriptional adapter 2-beta n=1 Tax=Heptranchias perlo TaxID=212740 RepID=UPI0035595C33
MAELGKKYCVYCLADVTSLRLRCTECQDIELCPECFSAGAEIGNHRRWHGYQLVDGGRFTLWGAEAEGGWTSREEQLLLDAIEQYGFGNWEDMAAHVGARAPPEVMEHYVSMYIHGNLGRACIPDSIPNRVTDHTCPTGGPLSPSLTTPLPPLDITVAEQQQLGYMPLRDDYEIEYLQDAETLISGLAVNYDDEDVDIELKRAHVDMYVRKLKERQRRKNMARDYSLVPVFLGKEKKEKPLKRKVTKEEKELRAKLRPICQFMSSKEFDDCFDNLHKERTLRAKIRELQRYRRNGITKTEESAEYEAARHKREKRKEMKNSAGAKRGKDDGSKEAAGEFNSMENLPGFDLLSEREKLLCSSLNLSPTRYLTVKTIIIKDYLQKRQGIPSKSRLPSYLDKVLKKRILNFLTESGWIARDTS